MPAFAPRLCALALALLALPAAAHRCTLGGEAVNPDNGAETEGKTGLLVCLHDDGTKMYEHELRHGEHIGLERSWGFDGALSERQVNARGNSEGPAKTFYPDGKLKSAGTYENGAEVGLAKAYHKNGQLAALRFYPKAGARAAVTIEYDEAGRLTDLACAPQSLIAEDRALCGYGSEVDISLYQRGRVAEKRRLRDGRALRREGYDAQGRLAESSEVTAKGRTDRRYFEDGKPAQESVIEGDYAVQRRTWYMNGALKAQIVTEPKERDAREVEENYRDSGALARREERRGRDLVRAETFDERGQRSEEFVYDADGRPKQHRKFGPDGAVLLDEELYADGSRKVLQKVAD